MDKRRWGWLVAALVAAAGLVPFLHKGTSELPVYVLGAERMLDGVEIYRTDDLKPFTYPPFFALPFAWAPGLGETVQRTCWYGINVAVLVWIARILAGLAAPLPARTRAWFFVLLAALSGRHVLAVFENQSHDLLVTACVVAAAASWSRARGLLSGIWAGLGAACKATPALFALPFVLNLRLAALVGATCAGLAATLLPDLVAPRDDGRLWAQAWIEVMLPGARPGASAELRGTWHAGSILNQGLAGTMYRLTTPPDAGLEAQWRVDAAVLPVSADQRRYVVLGAQLSVLLLVAWVCRPRATRGLEQPAAGLVRLAQAGAVASGMVLLSPMSSKSHFAVLLVPLAAALLVSMRVRRDLLLTGLLLVVFVLGTLLTKGLLGSRLGNLTLAYGSVTWTAFAALLASVRAGAVAQATRATPRDPAAPSTP